MEAIRSAQHAINNMTAQTFVKVSEAYGALIRASKFVGERSYENFNTEETIRLGDAHNCLIHYVSRILPKIPGDQKSPEQAGHFSCCGILKRMFQAEHILIGCNNTKWSAIGNNLTWINGQTMVDAKGNRLLRTQARPKRETDVQRENRIRRQLFDAFKQSDRALVALRERREVKATTTTEIPERWTYSESKKSGKAVAGSPVKLEDKCVICRENPITHGFLHHGLAHEESSAHFISCGKCANQWMWATKGCPKCRKPVVNVIKLSI